MAMPTKVLTRADDAAGHGRIGGEVDAARDIGAGQVQLQTGQAVAGADLGGHVNRLLLGLAGDVGDDRGRQTAQVGQVVAEEVVDAVVVQTDGIEHAGGCFHRARRSVALAQVARDGLGNDAAEPGEVDRAGHFTRVTKRAGRHQDGIGEAESSQGYGQIGHWFD
jgi:hypothetical protein